MSNNNSRFGSALFGDILFGDLGVSVVDTWVQVCSSKNVWSGKVSANANFSNQPLVASDWSEQNHFPASITKCRD